MNLYEYGIHTENSDIRAHVSVACECVFVFKTQNALDALNQRTYPILKASQPGCGGPTATGWIVPPYDIADVRRLDCSGWEGWPQFKPSMTPSQKGAQAVSLVLEIMRLGRFPIWLPDQRETSDRAAQIQGADILLHMNQRIQVKCDWKAGEKDKGGSGNLFLQKSERNPHKYT